MSSEGVPDKNYIGLIAGTFKKRFYGHKSTFRNEDLKGTTLRKYKKSSNVIKGSDSYKSKFT